MSHDELAESLKQLHSKVDSLQGKVDRLLDAAEHPLGIDPEARYSTRDVSDLLGLKFSTIYDHVRNGSLVSHADRDAEEGVPRRRRARLRSAATPRWLEAAPRLLSERRGRSAGLWGRPGLGAQPCRLASAEFTTPD